MSICADYSTACYNPNSNHRTTCHLPTNLFCHPCQRQLDSVMNFHSHCKSKGHLLKVTPQPAPEAIIPITPAPAIPTTSQHDNPVAVTPSQVAQPAAWTCGNCSAEFVLRSEFHRHRIDCHPDNVPDLPDTCQLFNAENGDCVIELMLT